MKAWDMIEVAKVFFDDKGQKRCGYCLGPIGSAMFDVFTSRCEYCGTKINNPIANVAMIGMAASALPIMQRMFDRLGFGPFGMFPPKKRRPKKVKPY